MNMFICNSPVIQHCFPITQIVLSDGFPMELIYVTALSHVLFINMQWEDTNGANPP